MQISDLRTTFLPAKGFDSSHITQVTQIASHWNNAINRELNRFAQFLWPDTGMLGLTPIRNYRLRKKLESDTYVWWVEHDIPPADRYRCEAYRVELSLPGPDQPRLVVRTGIFIYPVTPMNQEALKAVLLQAGADRPLLINREFGPALDP